MGGWRGGLVVALRADLKTTKAEGERLRLLLSRPQGDASAALPVLPLMPARVWMTTT